MLDPVYPPVILLLVVAFSLMAGAYGLDGSKRALAAYALGPLTGFPISSLLGPQGAIIALILGMLCALNSAALVPLHQAIPLLISLGAGAATAIHNFETHSLNSLPLATHLGIFLGPMVVAAALTGWIGMILQASTHMVKIPFRILSSWAFAADAIYLALQLKLGT